MGVKISNELITKLRKEKIKYLVNNGYDTTYRYPSDQLNYYFKREKEKIIFEEN